MDPRNQDIATEAVTASPGSADERGSAASRAPRHHSLSLMLLAGMALIVFMDWAEPILLPMVAALILSYALDPLLSPFDRMRIPRPVSAAVVMIVVLGASGAALMPLQYQFVTLLEKVPTALSRLQRSEPSDDEGVVAKAQELAEQIEKVAIGEPPPSRSETGAMPVEVIEAPFNINDFVLTNSSYALMLLTQFLSMMFLVYFLLAIGNLYRRKVVRLAGPRFKRRREMLLVIHEFHTQVRYFLFITLVNAAFVGLVTWLAFWWLDFEQAGFWGTVAGVASAIPYVGPFLVLLGTGMAAFVQFGTIEMTVVIAGVSLIITSIQGYLLLPMMTSRVSSLNTVAIFAGLLFWGWIWGAVGLILATPLLMMTKTACDHVRSLRPLGELLGK